MNPEPTVAAQFVVTATAEVVRPDGTTDEEND
jgi:hypothetical protein